MFLRKKGHRKATKVKLQVYVPRTDHQQLLKRAKARGLTVSEVVREIVGLHIEAEAAQGRTDINTNTRRAT